MNRGGIMKKDNLLFSKYKVLDTIGEGGTSTVYLAENIKLGNKWAIKKAYKAQSDISLHAEPNILIKLNHPAIPKIVDIEEDEEAIYIIEEYIEGIHLKDYKLQEPEIREEMIVDWAIQLCDILIYLHNLEPHPIIFRDIKPDNIIMTNEKRLYLVDFGIAREFKETSNNDTVPIGTRGYAAPEQYGIGQSDVRTDIFALGVTLYYLLTARNLSHPPYKITTIHEFNENVSDKLESIILKCCEILPNNRYHSMKALKKALIEMKEPPIKMADHPSTSTSNQNSNHSKIIKNRIKIQKTVIIGFLGVASKVGVTHIVLMIANYLSKNNKVAVLEMNNSMDLLDVCGLTKEEMEVDQHLSRYKKVDYYFKLNYSDFIANYRDRYDYVLVDYGSYEKLLLIDDYIKADIRYVIGHGIDWKIKEIQYFYNNTKGYDINKSWIYLVPFLDRKSIGDVKALFNNKVFAIPYNMNPFKLNNDTKKVFNKMMNGR